MYRESLMQQSVMEFVRVYTCIWCCQQTAICTVMVDSHPVYLWQQHLQAVQSPRETSLTGNLFQGEHLDTHFAERYSLFFNQLMLLCYVDW